jgi:hypothetical protein
MVTDVFVIHGHDARTAKYIILDNHAPSEIAATLQGYEITDQNVAFNIDVRTDQAVFSNNCIIPDEDEISNSSTFTDLCVNRNDALLPVNFKHAVLQSRG